MLEDIFTTAHFVRQKGRGQHAFIWVPLLLLRGMLKNQSCDWLTQFMKVIFLGISLVRISVLYLGQAVCVPFI